MFPSSGYFRGVNCPFYVSGLCERPNCHFRHSRVEEKPKPENGPNYSTSVKPYQPGTVQLFSSISLQANTYGKNDVAGYSTQTEAESSHVTHHNKTPLTSTSTCPIPSFSEGPQTLPEPDELPLHLDSLPKISGLPKPKPKSPGSSDLPSYIPTPKRVQLIVKGAVPSYNPTPKHADTGHKKHTSHTVEYDPVRNFSFRDKTNSDVEGVEDTDSKELVTNEPQNKGALPLHGETVQAVSGNSGGNNGNRQRKLGGGDSDLTDSDEDVSKNYEKNHSDEKLPHYAELLTPSSYFTNKLNSSVDRKLSSDSDLSLTVKSGVTVQHKSSISNNKSHKHNSSKSSHKSHHYKFSHHSHLSSKAPTSSSETKIKVLTATSLSSEKNNKSGSSNSNAKSHQSTSHSERKHSHSDKIGKIALKDKTEKSLLHSSRDVKIKSDSVSKKENKHKSTSLSSSSSHNKSSSSSSSSKNDSHSHKTGSSKASQKLSSKDLPNGQIVHKKKTEVQTSDKPSKHKLSDLKLSQSEQASNIKETAHQNGGTIKLSSKDLPNGQIVHTQKPEIQTSEKPSKHKLCNSKLSRSEQASQITETAHQNGAIIKKHSNNKSTHKSDSYRRSSLDGHISSSIKQQCKGINERARDDEKSTVRRKSGDSSVKELTKSQDRGEGSKIDTIRRASIETSKSVTKHKISNLTTNLFGEESEGSGSDADSKIADCTLKAPQPVQTISESDQEMEEDNPAALYTDDVDLLSDSDTFDECLRIFEETERCLAAQSVQSPKLGINPDTTKFRQPQKVAESSDSLLLSVIKKRMAHKIAHEETKRVKKTAAAFRPRLSPAEVMHNRIVEMQKRALLRAAKREGRESELPSKLVSSGLPSGNKVSSKPNLALSAALPLSSSLSEAASSLIVAQKKREAHTTSAKTPTKSAPSASGSTWSPNSFYNKKRPEPSTSTDAVPEKQLITIASTASKTEKRVAHEPTQINLKRPVIPAEFGTKVPSNVRQRYLNLMIDEYLKFTPEEAAFNKGQEEEQATYNRASNKNIYLRVAVNAIKKIRTEALESQPSTSKKQCMGLASLSSMTSSHPAQSHEATLGGSLAAKTSYTLHRSGNSTRKLPQTFSGKELYEQLKKYILTEEQLRENGYPRPGEDGSNKVRFFKEEEKDKMLKVDGSIDSRYGCCQERIGSKGCQVAKSHVHEKNKTDCLTGYMKTLPSSPLSDQNYGVYSLDCEMVYTKAGIELARVTVVGDDCSVKYESFVRPDAEIIDYNTRFSGITERDMQGVVTTLRGVQAVMLSMFCDKTILIGHSLESDLQALKLIHSTVVDTAIVFPHRLGPPYKRALRSLMVDHLQKIIQADDSGHDSKEDAVACMQLMVYKVKNDAKRRM
ncbi:hypothetical protein BsWGS_02618 [Bradybaena similaris]